MTTGVSTSTIPCLPSNEAFFDSLILPESRRVIRLYSDFHRVVETLTERGNHEPLFDAVKTEMNDFITNTRIIENTIHRHSVFERRFWPMLSDKMLVMDVTKCNITKNDVES